MGSPPSTSGRGRGKKTAINVGAGPSGLQTSLFTPSGGDFDAAAGSRDSAVGAAGSRPGSSLGHSRGGDEQPHGKITKIGRKRVRHVSEWKQNIAKLKRNKGLSYVSYTTGKVMPARKQGAPCDDGCFIKVGQEACEAIFKNCWDIGSYDERLNYFNSCLTEVKFKRKYTKKSVSKRPMRTVFSVQYSGKVTQVCRKGFMALHGMTPREMQMFLAKRKASLTGPLPKDKRGKHPSPHKITGLKLERVYEHIESIPVATSHYSRKKNPHKQYADSTLTIKNLYSHYDMWMMTEHRGEDRVTENFYRQIFTSCYNIGFKHPQTDMCNKCFALDQAMSDIRGIAEKSEELENLQAEKESHITLADSAWNLLKAQQKDEDPDCMIIAVDLQQTLPCPKLGVNRFYYTRKLWVYNLCIFDVKTKKSHMCLWDESTGGRGADEVASCIYRWLQENRQGRTKLRVFCDNCAGQNKNKFMVLMALQQIHLKTLTKVEFIFLISGHSFLPCDRSFGLIEKKLRTYLTIESPAQYADIIKSCNQKKFVIVNMRTRDFLNFHDLEKYCHWRTPTRIKGAFHKARQLVVSDQNLATYKVKLHYKMQDDPKSCFEVSIAIGGSGWRGGGGGKNEVSVSQMLTLTWLMLNYSPDILIIMLLLIRINLVT